jgi:dTDP-4-dehydrorhamnose reductase
LVTGASGSLGWVLAETLASDMDVIATCFSHPLVPEGTRRVSLDLDDPAAMKTLLAEYRPGVVYHVAAMTDPDQCERNPEGAESVNFTATRELAHWAGTAGAKLVFVSTDLVFDGSRGNYNENDEPAPLSVYGRTKLLAEGAVLNGCPRAVVIRSSLFYGIGGPTGRTFLSSLLGTLSRGDRMRLFVDQKRNPVFLEDVARAMITAAKFDLEGLFHVAGSEIVTRYEFGTMVCEAFGFDKSLLVPISMADFGYCAARPLDSTLDTAKFRSAAGFEPTPLGQALADLKVRYLLY